MSKGLTLAAGAMAVSVSLAGVGCGWVAELKAKKNIKDAHALYQAQNYKGAAAKYEAALQEDPNTPAALFYLANSYDNLYKPSRQGEPENDGYLKKAVEYYNRAAEKEQDPTLRQRALQFLVAAYGPDKLNDPTQAEPVVQRIIQMEPNEPTNYFVLAKIHEDSGDYEKAEAALLKAKEVRPNEPAVYSTLAGYYNRQGDFDKTIAALEERATREPDNPEAHYTISAYYEEKVRKDFRLDAPTKADYIRKGLEATDRALKIKQDYMEALTYKNILLRQQANMEKDPARQAALIKEADRLRDRAIELRKKKVAGIGD